MGRIKQASLKRVANDLMENYGGEFTTDFDTDKFKVQEHTDVRSKKIRNRIAGYIVKVTRNKEAEERKEQESLIESSDSKPTDMEQE
ncbi:MAG: 30S ribosomal protein S17e [Candidatus Altiarchaeales archaeon HGW-Altiarchaeales-3]|nr:MAG: 30S ribosomal protein S17e [Candidatus Altiarchaeales archaeon HGW-Altiarchaeales-3]